MAENDWLARRFEENRSHLRKVAYRMLGSMSEADDAVQEGSGRAKAARAALIDGVPGAVWAAGGGRRVMFGFTTANGRITGIEMIADTEHLAELDLEILGE